MPYIKDEDNRALTDLLNDIAEQNDTPPLGPECGDLHETTRGEWLAFIAGLAIAGIVSLVLSWLI